MSDDAGALTPLLRSAATIRVYDGGASGHRIFADKPVLTFTDPADLDALVRLLTVTRATDLMCMCHGDAAFELLDRDGELIDVVGWHHQTSVRWDGWNRDAVLAHGPKLVAWLAGHGYTAPHDRQVRRAEHQQDLDLARETWTAAAPAAIRDLVPELCADGGFPTRPDAVDDARRRLHDAHPRQSDRARELLRWLAGGTGRYSGHPVNERLPHDLLGELPLSALLAAVEGLPRIDPAWSGITRHLLSWKIRTDKELRRVPAPVWDAIADQARNEPDPTWTQRHDSVRRRLDLAEAQRTRSDRRRRAGRGNDWTLLPPNPGSSATSADSRPESLASNAGIT